jgi:hypothetical protein
MEKAILKTLIYYDVFNFPLKAWEIHKWLTGKQTSFQQVEKALKKLEAALLLERYKDYYFLPKRKGLVRKRLEKEKVSDSHFKTAKYIAALFKIIPWIKLVGVSGSLSMMGSGKKDDIDLFIITGNNRIWLCRLLLIFLTSLTGLRRKRREKILSANGKICINLILEEANLSQQKRNIYLGHEVLQMKVLWQREEIYSKFLHDNSWAFKYLPNWKSGILKKRSLRVNAPKRQVNLGNSLVDWMEEMAKKIQLRIMGNPDKSERIENGALYFHPEDKGVKVLEGYKKRLLSL